MHSRSDRGSDSVPAQLTSRAATALSRLNSFKDAVRVTAVHMTRKRTIKDKVPERATRSSSRLRLSRSLKRVPKAFPTLHHADGKTREDPSETENDQAHNTEPAVISSKKCEMIAIPANILHDLLQLLPLSKALPQIRKIYEESYYKLCSLEVDLMYAVEWEDNIVEWLRKRIDNITRGGMFMAEAEAEYTNRLIEHQRRLEVVQDAKDILHQQQRDLENLHERILSDHGTLLDEVLHDIQVQANQSNSFDLVSKLQTLQVKHIIDKDELEDYMKEIEDLREAGCGRNGDEREVEKDGDGYPLVLQLDWTKRLDELEAYREDFKTELDKNTELKNSMPDSMSLVDKLGENRQLQEQSCIVLQKYQLLIQAVENARMAGLICNSDGSILCDDDGLINKHTYDRERPRRWVEDENEEQASFQQVQKYLARSRETTERWLESAVLDRDPEKISPKTPRTPGSAAFGVRTDEVGVNDSISANDASKDSDDSDDSDSIRRILRARDKNLSYLVDDQLS